MYALLKCVGGSHESESFTKDKLYFMAMNCVKDDCDVIHTLTGTTLFRYSTGTSFVVCEDEEIIQYLNEIDNKAQPTWEDLMNVTVLKLSIIERGTN